MEVSLVSYTADPVYHIGRCGAISHGRNPLHINQAEARKIYRKVLDAGHWSVLEHASFTFYVSGVTRILTHQLVRHRLMSYTQESQRFTNSGDDFVMPSKLSEGQKDRVEKFIKESFELYTQLIKEGVKKEDARFILTQAMTTNIIVTANYRALREFLIKRLCMKAQWEINELAWRMYDLLFAVDPELIRHLGPPCIAYGRCPETRACDYKLEDIKKMLRIY